MVQKSLVFTPTGCLLINYYHQPLVFRTFKLTANAFSSKNFQYKCNFSPLRGNRANVDEVATIGTDSRIGPKFSKVRSDRWVMLPKGYFKSLLSPKLIFQAPRGCRILGAGWMNEYQKERFVTRILDSMFTTVSGKRIAILKLCI